MKSPWKTVHELSPDRDYVALASTIPPVSRGSTWRWFRGSRSVASQLLSTAGVVGFAMSARPIKKEYLTLSLWTDDAAIEAFAGSGLHGSLQRRLASEAGVTSFVRWSVRGSDGLPTWNDARAHLRDAEASQGGGQ
jgi:hypothetical protein